MATPPTFVAESEIASWAVNTTPRNVSRAVTAGDRIVVIGVAANDLTSVGLPSDGVNTYTAVGTPVQVTDFCWVQMWTATAATTTTLTIACARGGTGGDHWGIDVLTFNGSDGFGATSKNNVSGTAPSLALTTAADNSAIVGVYADWNAGAITGRTWRTINSITPTSGNGLERVAVQDSGTYTIYVAYWSDAGTAGSKTTGMSAPTGQKVSMIALEVKGAASADVVIQTNAGGAGAGSSTTTAAIDRINSTGSGGSGAGSSKTTQATDQVRTTGSGGAAAGSSTTTLTEDQVRTTTSGGAGAGSSRTFTDQARQTGSGGAGAGSSQTTQATDLVRTTGSGGAGAGSSQDTQVIDQVRQTVSGGAGAGSSANTLSGGSSFQTNPGGAGAGSSPTTPAIDRLFTTGSGGAGAGSSKTAFSNDTTLATGSGGAGAGSSPGTSVIDRITTTTSGGAGAGSSRTSSPAGPVDVIIQTRSGGAGAGSSATTLQGDTEVVHDKMVMPVLLVAEACLTTEANKVAKPPALYQIRPGASFVAYADQTTDECCNGIGWVRPGPMWETDDFPVQRTGASNVEPADYAITVEIGILRCLPTQSNVDSMGRKVTTGQWLQATQEAMDDAAALRRVVCCLRELYHVDAVVAGQLIPLENEADCAGTSITVTMRVPACDCFDAG